MYSFSSFFLSNSQVQIDVSPSFDYVKHIDALPKVEGVNHISHHTMYDKSQKAEGTADNISSGAVYVMIIKVYMAMQFILAVFDASLNFTC